MKIIHYPDREKVDLAIKSDDPLLMLISYDEENVIMANIDDSFEHIILLKSVGFHETDIDKYFRIIVNNDGADWTFVCPSGYKNISDKTRRIKTFFNDGIDVISKVLKSLGYDCDINIPQRYKRHFNMISDNE